MHARELVRLRQNEVSGRFDYNGIRNIYDKRFFRSQNMKYFDFSECFVWKAEPDNDTFSSAFHKEHFSKWTVYLLLIAERSKFTFTSTLNVHARVNLNVCGHIHVHIHVYVRVNLNSGKRGHLPPTQSCPLSLLFSLFSSFFFISSFSPPTLSSFLRTNPLWPEAAVWPWHRN